MKTHLTFSRKTLAPKAFMGNVADEKIKGVDVLASQRIDLSWIDGIHSRRMPVVY